MADATPTPTDQTTTPPTPTGQTPPAAAPAPPTPKPPETPEADKSRSQEDVKKRLDRAKAQGANDLAKSLGYESAEAMRAALDKSKGAGEAKGGTQSELDAVKAQLLRLTELAEKSQQEAEALKAQRRGDATLNALKTVVKGMRLKDTVAEDMLALAALQKRDTSTLVKDDLTPDTAAITTLINDMRTARPEWFKTAGPGSPSAMLGTPTDADEKKKQAAAEAQWRAIRRGG